MMDNDFMRVNVLLLSMATIVAFNMPSASAQDGQLSFTGEITDQVCTVKQPDNQIINLGKISSKAFNGTGDTAGSTSFSIQLADCPDSVKSVNVKFDGNPDNGNPEIIALTKDKKSASGVGVQITDKDSKVVSLGVPTRDFNIDPGSKINNLDFIARYITNGQDVKPGLANATASFTITYN
ncbi:fimbrial protein [Escherichia coli]